MKCALLCNLKNPSFPFTLQITNRDQWEDIKNQNYFIIIKFSPMNTSERRVKVKEMDDFGCVTFVHWWEGKDTKTKGTTGVFVVLLFTP